MKTTITIVDPFKGTLVVETEGNAEVRIDGNSTCVKVDGEEFHPESPKPVQIRTPEPEAQSMNVKDGTGKELPQGSSEEQPPLPRRFHTSKCDMAYQLQFIRENMHTIVGKCTGCGAFIYIDKKLYSDSELQKIRNEMKKKPAESPQDEPEDKKPVPAQSEPEALKLDGPAPRKKAKKHCATCGKEFEGANRQIYCDEHKTGGKKNQAADSEGNPTPDSPLPEGMWWCIHHKAQMPHRSPDCPLIEDAPEKRATDEEAAVFTDPWDCGRCRTDGRVCRFHRSMEASGHKPPRIRPS